MSPARAQAAPRRGWFGTIRVGVGWGRVLCIGDVDIYGAEVNAAIDASHDVGPLMSRNTSPGMSILAITPA